MTGDIYQHFKGNFYEECANSNLDGQDVIIYKKLYDDFSYWIRPVNMFRDYKELNGKKVERFKKVKEKEFISDMKTFDQALWEKHRKTFNEPFRLFKLGLFFTIFFITLEYYGKISDNILILLNIIPIIIYSIDLVLFKKSVNKDLEERNRNNNFYNSNTDADSKVLYQFPATHSETEEEYVVAVNADEEVVLFTIKDWEKYGKVEVKGKYLTTAGFNVIMLQLSLLLFHLLSNLHLGEFSSLRHIAVLFGLHGLYQFKKNILS